MCIEAFATGIQHVGIPTNDLEKTVAFYERLGFAAVLRTRNDEADEAVAFLQIGNLIIEAYENHRALGSPGAIDHIAIDVTDIGAVFELLSQGGFALLNKEIRFLPFWGNGVRFFTIEGPNKEKIEFCQRL